MTEKFVQQQMYTRERGGIFHATDGYDTIAISTGLDKAFVKEYLHPFCSYSSPKVLTERGEIGRFHYPEALTLLQPEMGDLVIGQAVFVPADFTGTRSTYFMHNFIIPPERKEEWIKEPAKIFQITDFATSYDTELGKILPECDDIGYAEHDILAQKDELLVKIGIKERHFKQLLYAVMSSIAGKKKVFISLNVPLKDYSKYALQLLELIYFYLPYAYRRKFGAMTFTSEPEAKKYIHVMFFEPGTLNYNDRSLEKQYIFDFADSRILGVNIKEERNEYLELAATHLSKAKDVDNFLDFAELMVSGLPEEQQLDLTSYHQLAAIYLTINYKDAPYYKNNEVTFLHSLQKFLAVNTDEKQTLVQLFLQILTKEKVAKNKSTALDYIEAVISINSFIQCDEALSFMKETLKYHQNDQLFHNLWNVIERDKISYQAIIMDFNEHTYFDGLLDLYFVELFNQFIRVEDILNKLKWIEQAPYLLSIEKYKSIAIKKVVSTIKNENSPIASLVAVKDFNVDLESAEEFTEFKDNMLEHALAAFLIEVDPQELVLPDIFTFGENFPNMEEWKDTKAQEHYLTIIALYELFTNPENAQGYNLKQLSSESRQQLKNTIRKLVRSNPEPAYFPLLFIAFRSEFKGVNYPGLLEYLVRFSHEKTILSFILDNARLIDSDRSYKKALKKYFISHPRSIWKNKSLRKELKSVKSYTISKFIKDIENETTNPLVKFLKRYGVSLSMGLIALGIGGGIWYGFFHDSKPKVEKTNDTVVTDSSGNKTALAKKKQETSPQKTSLGNKNKNAFSHLESFKTSTNGEDAKSFKIALAGEQVKNINGQTESNFSFTIVMTDQSGTDWQLNLPNDLDNSPFDEDGKIKPGFSFYGLEHDFSGTDAESGTGTGGKNPEFLLVATDKTTESYIWVFPSSRPKNGLKILNPILSERSFSDIKIEKDKLIVQKNGQDLTFNYLSNDKFVLQK